MQQWVVRLSNVSFFISMHALARPFVCPAVSLYDRADCRSVNLLDFSFVLVLSINTRNCCAVWPSSSPHLQWCFREGRGEIYTHTHTHLAALFLFCNSMLLVVPCLKKVCDFILLFVFVLPAGNVGLSVVNLTYYQHLIYPPLLTFLLYIQYCT